MGIWSLLLYYNNNFSIIRCLKLVVKFLNGILLEILFRIKHIGRLPICNCRKDRAPCIGNFSFLLCWRCTSILTSYFILKIVDAKRLLFSITPSNTTNVFILIVSVLLMIPTAINGINQYQFGIESTNKKRILTGLLCGIGIYFLLNILKYTGLR